MYLSFYHNSESVEIAYFLSRFPTFRIYGTGGHLGVDFRIGERGSIGNQFHNNTMYWDHGYAVNAVEQASWGTPVSSGTQIYNNIFYGDSDLVVNNAGVTYSNNCVWGGVEDAYPMDADPYVIVADPMLVDPSQAPDGSFTREAAPSHWGMLRASSFRPVPPASTAAWTSCPCRRRASPRWRMS